MISTSTHFHPSSKGPPSSCEPCQPCESSLAIPYHDPRSHRKALGGLSRVFILPHHPNNQIPSADRSSTDHLSTDLRLPRCFSPPPSPSSPSRRYVASPKNKNITVFPSFPAIILNVIITIFSLRFRYRPCDDDDVGNVAFCVRTTTAATGSFRVIFYWCVLRYRIYVCKHIHTKRAVWIKKR